MSMCFAGKTVGVFCSADNKINAEYKEAIRDLGERLAESGFNLVTGGSETGLMKEVADGFLSKGSAENFYGILPETFRSLNIAHKSITEKNKIWTETVHNRLKVFHNRCDMVVVAPGGWGTLHELMDFLVHNQFDLIKTKIVLLNIDGFWDGILAQFEKMKTENALNPKHFDLFFIALSIEHCMNILHEENMSNRDDMNLRSRYWEEAK